MKRKSPPKSATPVPIVAPEANKPFLYFTVTLSGAAVMILELLGTRIIGPFYGVSLYVWSSLIAVTLIALALGYFLGGFLADRVVKFRLAHVILLAALATLVIPYISSRLGMALSCPTKAADREFVQFEHSVTKRMTHHAARPVIESVRTRFAALD